MYWLGGNPLDQSDPSQAGGFTFSLIAFIFAFLLVIWAISSFLIQGLPNLIKLRSLTGFKLWLKALWTGSVALIVITALLCGLGAVLYKIGL